MRTEQNSHWLAGSAARTFRSVAVARVAVIVFCAAFLAAIGGCDSKLAEPEIHLIPAGYAGDVFIIHNAYDGERLQKSGLSRVYRIPVDGILRSRSDVNDGVQPKPVYFYVAASGEKTPIEGYWPNGIDDTPENRADPGIFFPRSGMYSSGELPCEVVYEQYFVGTKRQILSRASNDDEVRFERHIKDRPPCLRNAAEVGVNLGHSEAMSSQAPRKTMLRGHFHDREVTHSLVVCAHSRLSDSATPERRLRRRTRGRGVLGSVRL